ncbi:MAG: hypothetical protein LBM78_01810 [Clostridiales bacterium]|jgi:hypothetical protein|nr:hypothetical protein [Clostridiales bacterium]
MQKYPYLNDFTLPVFDLQTTRKSPSAVMRGGGTAPYTPEKMQLAQGEDVIFDFGAETVGRFFFSAAPRGGAGGVRVVYGEFFEELFMYADPPRADWYAFPTDAHAVAGAGQYPSAGRRAFRYVRILCGAAPVLLWDVFLREQRYPVEERGRFNCSDEGLNEIWKICKRTTALCMQQYYEDGIKRDGLLWVSDARVQALCNYALFGDLELTRKSLKYFAMNQDCNGRIYTNAAIAGAHQHPDNIAYMFDYITDPKKKENPDFYTGCGEIYYLSYAADFISMLHDYYVYSGDAALVRTLWSFAVRDAADLFGRRASPSQLLPPADADLQSGKYVDVLNYPASFYAAALCALNDYRSLARLLGDDAQEQKGEMWRRFYTDILKNEFTAPDGTPFARTPGGETVYPHSLPAFGLMSGLLNADLARQCFSALPGNPDAAPPTDGRMRYWVLRGMFEAGLEREALREIRRFWGYMVEKGATTAWEKLDCNRPDIAENDYLLSRCHGWSAGPADLFARYLLGVRPVDAGYTRVVVKPDLCGLTYVEGRVPTVKGDICVYADDRGTVRVKLPDGITLAE